MNKTLYENYIDRTTKLGRNKDPREEGIVSTLSDIIERECSFENLPNALPKLHEFHKLWINRSKANNNEEEIEKIATMFDICLSMMIFDRHLQR